MRALEVLAILKGDPKKCQPFFFFFKGGGVEVANKV